MIALPAASRCARHVPYTLLVMNARNGERSIDVAVIGAGTAGLAAFRAAAAGTPRLILIEGGPLGTTCARVGCMPSKLLIAAADAAHAARHAGPFGVRTSLQVDGPAIMARVRRERDRFVNLAMASVEGIPHDQRLTGHARFIEPGVLDVDGTIVRARAVVVATGASPVVPPMFSEVRDHVVVSDDVFGWSDLPDSVAVFGAGIIGLELGQALHRLGVRVRVFGKGGGVGPITDPVVRASAASAFRAEMAIDLDAKLHGVRLVDDRVLVEWEGADGGALGESFSRALVAVGRRPNLDGLDAERGGIQRDDAGKVVFDRATMRVGATNVFFAGDASGDLPLLHEASDEGTIAGENAARFPEVRPSPRRSQLIIVFTDPELAVAGGNFVQASGRKANTVIGEIRFEDQGRSSIMMKNQGAARVYADGSSGRFLGFEMAGPRAEHIGHLLAWAHQQAMTIDQMLAMPFYHPVVEEGIRTALRDVKAKLEGRR
jgi:dihydrolipoamide dehydrogenase